MELPRPGMIAEDDRNHRRGWRISGFWSNPFSSVTCWCMLDTGPFHPSPSITVLADSKGFRYCSFHTCWGTMSATAGSQKCRFNELKSSEAYSLCKNVCLQVFFSCSTLPMSFCLTAGSVSSGSPRLKETSLTERHRRSCAPTSTMKIENMDCDVMFWRAKPPVKFPRSPPVARASHAKDCNSPAHKPTY